MRCQEQLEFLPFSADHLWERNDGGSPAGECVKCGITPDEWIHTFENRLEEMGEVGVAVLRISESDEEPGLLIAIDVKR